MRVNSDNTVFVGHKSTMEYVNAATRQFQNGNSTINLKARGKAINRAVDVACIMNGKYKGEIKTGFIDIGTETVLTENNQPMKISTIEIELVRP